MLRLTCLYVKVFTLNVQRMNGVAERPKLSGGIGTRQLSAAAGSRPLTAAV